MTVSRGELLTVERRKNVSICIPQESECFFLDMNVRQMRNEIIADQIGHENPIVDDTLQIVGKGEFVLQRERERDNSHIERG